MNAGDTIEKLVAKIHQEFPLFAFEKVEQAKTGDDHIALFFDDAWVFRFPREISYIESFKRELQLLCVLRPETIVPIPHYTYVARDGSFGGYCAIKGELLTWPLFARLSRAAQESTVDDLANFLSALHSLPPDTPVPQETWGPLQYFERYRARRSTIAANIPDSLAKKTDVFYEKFAALEAVGHVAIHHDLRDQHIFIDKQFEKISGIIDFGDVGYGDPAIDFSFFWAYGDWVPQELCRRVSASADSELLVRSHQYFIRFLIDQLYYAKRDNQLERGEQVHKLLIDHIDR